MKWDDEQIALDKIEADALSEQAALAIKTNLPSASAGKVALVLFFLAFMGTVASRVVMYRMRHPPEPDQTKVVRMEVGK